MNLSKTKKKLNIFAKILNVHWQILISSQILIYFIYKLLIFLNSKLINEIDHKIDLSENRKKILIYQRFLQKS